MENRRKIENNSNSIFEQEYSFFLYYFHFHIYLFFSLRAAMPLNQDGRKKSNSVFADEFINGVRRRVSA